MNDSLDQFCAKAPDAMPPDCQSYVKTNRTFKKRMLSKHTRQVKIIILLTTKEFTWLNSVPLFHRPPRIQDQQVPAQNIFCKVKDIWRLFHFFAICNFQSSRYQKDSANNREDFTRS